MDASSTATTTDSPLRLQVMRVQEARRNAEALGGALKSKREAFERDNADIIGLLREAQNALLEEELRLRDMAVAEFKATGDAKPGPGVQIKQETVIEYETTDAFSWALQTGMALTLDKKAFEQIAKATPLDFVTVTNAPKATIATDLAKALAGGAA